MFKLIFIVILISSFIVSYESAEIMSLDDLKRQYFNLIVECSHEYPLNAVEIEQLKNKLMPESEAAKCLFACAYKKSGMMNDDGMLSVVGVNEITRKFLSNDPDRMEKARDFTQACEYVNNLEVSDGQRGCERAALIFKCCVEMAPQFDFAI